MHVITAPPLPSAASYISEAFYTLRRLTHCFGTAQQISTNATAFGSWMGGLLLSCCCGDNKTVRMSARIVMITQRAIATAKAQIACAHSIMAMKEAFKPSEELPPAEAVSLTRWHFLPVSHQKRMGHTLNRVIEAVKKFVYHLFSTIVLLFVISNHLVDLARAIQGEEEAINQGVREIFINCSSCLEDSRGILEELTLYEVNIHRAADALQMKRPQQIRPPSNSHRPLIQRLCS